MVKKIELPQQPDVPGTQEVYLDGITAKAKTGERGVTSTDYDHAEKLVNAEYMGRAAFAKRKMLILRLIEGVQNLFRD